jgi:hypothetical protein
MDVNGRRYLVLKCGCALLVGTIFTQSLAPPVCPHGNVICEEHADAPHTPNEQSPRGMGRVSNSIPASGNVVSHVVSINFGTSGY